MLNTRSVACPLQLWYPLLKHHLLMMYGRSLEVSSEDFGFIKGTFQSKFHSVLFSSKCVTTCALSGTVVFIISSVRVPTLRR